MPVAFQKNSPPSHSIWSFTRVLLVNHSPRCVSGEVRGPGPLLLHASRRRTLNRAAPSRRLKRGPVTAATQWQSAAQTARLRSHANWLRGSPPASESETDPGRPLRLSRRIKIEINIRARAGIRERRFFFFSRAEPHEEERLSDNN